MHFSQQSIHLQLLPGHRQVCLDKDRLGTVPTITYATFPINIGVMTILDYFFYKYMTGIRPSQQKLKKIDRYTDVHQKYLHDPYLTKHTVKSENFINIHLPKIHAVMKK